MFKLLFSFRTVFDHFSDGWVALKNVDAIWTTNDGRTPKPETIPWAKSLPFREDLKKCTAINRHTAARVGNGANIENYECLRHRTGLCEKPVCLN